MVQQTKNTFTKLKIRRKSKIYTIWKAVKEKKHQAWKALHEEPQNRNNQYLKYLNENIHINGDHVIATQTFFGNLSVVHPAF